MHMSPRQQAAPRAASHARRRVLVASGDWRLRAAASQAVESAGFDAVQARTGAQALLADPAQLSAVVLDIELPDIDGFRVCRQLRACAGPADLPVIYTCGPGVSTQSRFAALESGAQACLMQPLDPVVLVSLLHALLPRFQAAAPAGGPARQTLEQIARHADTIDTTARRVLAHRVDDPTLVALNTVLHCVQSQRSLLQGLLDGPAPAEG